MRNTPRGGIQAGILAAALTGAPAPTYALDGGGPATRPAIHEVVTSIRRKTSQLDSSRSLDATFGKNQPGTEERPRAITSPTPPSGAVLPTIMHLKRKDCPEGPSTPPRGSDRNILHPHSRNQNRAETTSTAEGERDPQPIETIDWPDHPYLNIPFIATRLEGHRHHAVTLDRIGERNIDTAGTFSLKRLRAMMEPLEKAGIRILFVRPKRQRHYVTVDLSKVGRYIRTETRTREDGHVISRPYLDLPDDLDVDPKGLITDLERLFTFVELTHIKNAQKRYAGKKPRHKDHREGGKDRRALEARMVERQTQVERQAQYEDGQYKEVEWREWMVEAGNKIWDEDSDYEDATEAGWKEWADKSVSPENGAASFHNKEANHGVSSRARQWLAAMDAEHEERLGNEQAPC